MHQAKIEKITFKFKQPSGTSRGVLTSKDSWIISVWKSDQPSVIGKGEASIIKTLSPDWSETYEGFLEHVAKNITYYLENITELSSYPSIQFAIETAKLDLKNGGNHTIFKTDIAKIPINGLVWMGSADFMLKQVDEKIKAGYNCIKLKIGAIDFEEELSILKHIRKQYSAEKITLRVDANGAFQFNDALEKLTLLSLLDIHSIEQPIKAGNWEAMSELCKITPLPIALDEELIGIVSEKHKFELLNKIKPQFIILKPSLIGGIKGTDEWISIAQELNINWWVTSALESNIGLNAIAQYTATKRNVLPQGLGTGSLYINNIPPFLKVKDGYLWI